MSSNFEWQKQEANERVRARLREAEMQRLVNESGNGRSSLTSLFQDNVKFLGRALRKVLHKGSGQTAPIQDAVERRERLV